MIIACHLNQFLIFDNRIKCILRIWWLGEQKRKRPGKPGAGCGLFDFGGDLPGRDI